MSYLYGIKYKAEENDLILALREVSLDEYHTDAKAYENTGTLY